MSEEKIEAYREEAKAEIKRVKFWTNFLYKIALIVCVSITTKVVTSGANGAVNVYADFKELKKDRDEDKKAHLAQVAIDRAQDSAIAKSDSRLWQAEADIANNQKEIITLKFK